MKPSLTSHAYDISNIQACIIGTIVTRNYGAEIVSILPTICPQMNDMALEQITCTALMYNGKMRAGTAASLVKAYKQLQKRIKEVKARKPSPREIFWANL
jgi:hypothetical protein